jgi:hypothetical protein
MYYAYKNAEFYKKKYRNMYMFGTELIVIPITRPAKSSSKTEISYADAFLPQGNYTDIFTGFRYTVGEKGRRVRMFRGLDGIPVLAKDGAILTTDENFGTETKNPEILRVTVFPGADNSFKLYEDDGESADYKNGAFVLTEFELKGDRKDFTLTIKAPDGDISLIPAARVYRVELFGVAAVGRAAVTCKDGREVVLAETSGGEAPSSDDGKTSASNSDIKKSYGINLSASNSDIKKSYGINLSASDSETKKSSYNDEKNPPEVAAKKSFAYFDGRSLIISVETDDIYDDIKVEIKGAEYASFDKEEYIKNAVDKIASGFFSKARRYKRYKKDGKFRFRGLKGIDKEIK